MATKASKASRDGGRGVHNGRGGKGGRGNHPTTSSASPRPPGLPANWPLEIAYLTTPYYSGISPQQRKLLQTQPADMPGAPASTPPLPEIPPILRFGPSSAIEIRPITDPAHPAHGQRGLFAARHLPANAFILPYLGVYHRGNVAVGGGGTNIHNKRESDYDLWLDRDVDVAIDADRRGNEARFANDYRGTGKPRANAEFRQVWDPRRGERGMAIFVLPAGKRAVAAGLPTGIAKGDEILLSYGKGFWDMRRKEAEAEAAKTAGADIEATPAAVEPLAAPQGPQILHSANGTQHASGHAGVLTAAKMPKNAWFSDKEEQQ